MGILMNKKPIKLRVIYNGSDYSDSSVVFPFCPIEVHGNSVSWDGQYPVDTTKCIYNPRTHKIFFDLTSYDFEWIELRHDGNKFILQLNDQLNVIRPWSTR